MVNTFLLQKVFLQIPDINNDCHIWLMTSSK